MKRLPYCSPLPMAASRGVDGRPPTGLRQANAGQWEAFHPPTGGRRRPRKRRPNGYDWPLSRRPTMTTPGTPLERASPADPRSETAPSPWRWFEKNRQGLPVSARQRLLDFTRVVRI